MRITYSYNGKQQLHESGAQEVVIGRAEDGVEVDLDLSPDQTVSRRHARIWVADERCWIEDLKSRRGTQVNGEAIKPGGQWELQPADQILIGQTHLQVDFTSAPEDSLASTPAIEASTLTESLEAGLDPEAPNFAEELEKLLNASRRLALFYELPLRLGEENQLPALLQLIVERVVSLIIGARRGALLVKEGGKLALKAHLPAGNPSVSLTLAQQAMEQRRAFIWPPPPQPQEGRGTLPLEKPPSVIFNQISSALYAPLLWRGEALGVICIDNCETCGSFNHDDLRLLQAVAHHAALAVANLQLQEKWRHQAATQKNILKLVSPQIAQRLQEQRGPVRLGGEFRAATILVSDIRGFTNLSATMSPYEVTEMLEDYFGRLVPLVFQHQGLIDKFVGDAILAVFGSPHPDEQQQFHAVQTALGMQAAMREVNAQRAAQGKRTGELGIGIHCGEVVHGFIGTNERMEFTVIGDTVNRASRYCDGARGGEVLISPEVHQWVWNAVEAGQTSIATKHEGNLTAYRIDGLKSFGQ